jgi:hypothetical protein
MYIKLIDGIPRNYSIAQLRQDNPGTSFPDPISEELLAAHSVYPLSVSAAPEYNRLTHALKSSPIYQVGGQWRQHYVPEPLPEAVVTVRADAARSEAYAKEADPIFFRAQRGEATQQDWLDKVAEIKARYPKVIE